MLAELPLILCPEEIAGGDGPEAEHFTATQRQIPEEQLPASLRFLQAMEHHHAQRADAAGLPRISPRHLYREEHERAGQVRDTFRRAIGKATRVRPELSWLAEHVLPRMPGMPLTSWTLKSSRPSSRTTYLEAAVHAPWVALNTPAWTNAIWIDCDVNPAEGREPLYWAPLLEKAISAGLPPPTWVCIDPWTGSAHLVWWLDSPVCMGPEGKPRPKSLLRRVRDSLDRLLLGDAANAMGLTKWPWGKVPKVGINRFLPKQMPSLWRSHEAVAPDMAWMSMAPGDPNGVKLWDLWAPLKTLAAPGQQLFHDLPRPAGGGRRRGEYPTAAWALSLPKGRRLFLLASARVRWLRLFDRQDIHDIYAQAADELQSPATAKVIESLALTTWRFMENRWWGSRRPSRAAGQVEKLSDDDRQARLSAGGRMTSQKARDKAMAEIYPHYAALLKAGEAISKGILARLANTSLSRAARVLKRIRDGEVPENSSSASVRTSSALAVPSAPPSLNGGAPAKRVSGESRAEETVRAAGEVKRWVRVTGLGTSVEGVRSVREKLLLKATADELKFNRSLGWEEGVRQAVRRWTLRGEQENEARESSRKAIGEEFWAVVAAFKATCPSREGRRAAYDEMAHYGIQTRQTLTRGRMAELRNEYRKALSALSLAAYRAPNSWSMRDRVQASLERSFQGLMGAEKRHAKRIEAIPAQRIATEAERAAIPW